MTTSITINFRRFFGANETVGHVPAFHSSLSGSHHFAHFAAGMLDNIILFRLDCGETRGSYQKDGATVVWEAAK